MTRPYSLPCLVFSVSVILALATTTLGQQAHKVAMIKTPPAPSQLNPASSDPVHPSFSYEEGLTRQSLFLDPLRPIAASLDTHWSVEEMINAGSNANSVFLESSAYSSGGYRASSVAVADLNGDGRMDLVVANECQSSSDCHGSISVLLGNGDGTFQAPVNYLSGGYYASSISIADLKGDGRADLIVANQCQSSSNCIGTISVLLGNGDGTFQSPTSYSSGGQYACSLAIGDLNGDGRADVVVTNFGAASVLLGNGNGTLRPAVSYSAGGQNVYSAVIADANGDGHPDLIVASQCRSNGDCTSGGVSILAGNGDGTFQAPIAYGSGGYEATSLAVGDVNGDGYPDLIVANWCQSNSNCGNGIVSVLFGNGSGSFQSPISYNTGGYQALSVAIGDVNGDGHPDLIVANQCQSGSYCNGVISVLMGNGDSTFESAVTYGSGGYETNTIVLGDVNGDGSKDIVAANWCESSTNCTNGTATVLLGNGDGTFHAALSYPGGYQAYAYATGDVNGDGSIDLIVANGTRGVSVLLGKGDGTFRAPVTYAAGYEATSIALGDLNEDGYMDLIVTNECQGSGHCNGLVDILLGNGDGTFRSPLSSSSGGMFAYPLQLGM